MGYYRHGRANANPSAPRAWAVCDRCGFQINHADLRAEKQWTGSKLTPTGFLVCSPCLDVPQQNLRSISIPADPVPIANPRKNYGGDV